MKVGPLSVVLAVRTLRTARVLAAELPQELLAMALIFPPAKTLLSILTLMTLVVEVPVMPAGNVHV